MKDLKINDIGSFSKGELEFLSKPILLFIVVAIVFFSITSLGYNKIVELNGKIKANESVVKNLTQKVSTLQTVNTILPDNTLFLDIVLPSKGAVLYGLSQVKMQASEYGLLVSSLKTGTETTESGDISRLSISFEAEGSQESLFNFLDSFTKVLPLMNVAKVNINKSGDIVRANITLNVYSAELPKKIPTVSESVKGFNKEEVDLLNELVTYKTPNFSSVNENQENSTNERDPFN